jgi:hypothetical protein
MLTQVATNTNHLDKEANMCVAIGATYEGRDPRLLERMLPLVGCIEVTLERTCVLTFTLLKRRNLLQETLSAFITQHNISPFSRDTGAGLPGSAKRSR